MPISALLLAFLAVPLAKSRPRQGRYGKMMAGVMVYFIYFNLLGAAQVWVEQGELAPAIERAMARKEWMKPLADDEIPTMLALGRQEAPTCFNFVFKRGGREKSQVQLVQKKKVKSDEPEPP